MNSRSLLLPALLASSITAHAQLVVNNAPTPQQLVQTVLLGGGVTASNITFNGMPGNLQNEQIGTFNGSSSNIGLPAGVLMGTGDINVAPGPNTGGGSSQGGGNFGAGDADLTQISGVNHNDAAILEFDFIPTGDTLRFRYVFASEEYDEYVCGSVNDAFGFFLSGPGFAGPFLNGAENLAIIPGGNIPVSINTVNLGVAGSTTGGNAANCLALDPNFAANSVYYQTNAGGLTVEYDGFTVVLTAFALVNCGTQYHIKMAIADGGDTVFDSGVFLEAGSFTSTGNVIPTLAGGVGINGTTMLEGCNPVELIFTRLGDTTEVDTVDIFITGTATPGVDYGPALPAQLIFPASEETISFILNIPIDADGPETITITIEQLIDCAGIVIQTVFNFQIDSPPPLVVVPYDIDGICNETHLLDPDVSGGMGQYTYLWSTGETTETITVGPGVTTTYSVTVSDICGVTPVTEDFVVTLPIYPPLDITVDPATEIDCLSTGPISVTSATGGDNTYTYQWSLNGQPLNPGNTATVIVPNGPPMYYVVTVTEGCGTSVMDSVLVSTVPLPPIVVEIVPYETVICTGDTTVLEMLSVTGGSGVYTLAWTDPNGALLSTADTLQVGVPFDQTYTLTATDQCLNTGFAVETTRIPIYEDFRLELGPDLVMCAGDSVELLALVTGGSGYYTLLWHQPDSLSDPLFWMHPDVTTEYVVSAKDQCGEEVMDDVEVEVEHVFTDIEVTNKGQDDWYLQAATLPYAQNWVWDMGDGTRYRLDEVYHSYVDLEEHWVTLKIVTPNGCQGVDSVLLRPPAHIYFPNAFTPDGDGLNELFGPLGHYIEEFEMTIFDRWGEVIFNTKDVNVLWDGKVNGSDDAMTGVYVYTYRVVGHLFPATDGIGHVTLLRGTQD